MNRAPTVDIVVPCYNVANIVKKCVNSLLKQSYSTNSIIIYLVNDGSSDETGDILESFANHQQIQVIHHKVNKKLSAARNTGINAGNGEVICFLDSDMVVNKNWVETHVDILSDMKIVGVVGDQIPPKEIDSNKLDKYFYDKRRGARQFGENTPIRFPYFLFSNASIRRSALNSIGLFDETFTSYGGEDTELAIRLWETFPISLRFSFDAACENHGNRTFQGFCTSMYEYGKTNLLLLLSKYPQYKDELGGGFIKSIKGYLIFNPIIRMGVNLLDLNLPSYWLKRYQVIDSIIRGARES